MTKAELVDKVSCKIDLNKKQTTIVIETMFQSITDSLAKGDKVELRGFGSFRVRHRDPRIARNPKSGEVINVPAKKIPFFRAGIDLRKVVDRNGKESSHVTQELSNSNVEY